MCFLYIVSNVGINFPFKKWDKTSLFRFGTKVPIFSTLAFKNLRSESRCTTTRAQFNNVRLKEQKTILIYPIYNRHGHSISADCKKRVSCDYIGYFNFVALISQIARSA